MFTQDNTTAVVRHPFGRVGGTITYTPTLVPDMWMVHALIVSMDQSAVAADLALGWCSVKNQFDAFRDGQPALPATTAHPVVTHYVGTARWSARSTAKAAVEHHVIGSANPSYVGRVLVREALLSADRELLLLRGPLGMDPSVNGCILWRRLRPGKL
jgi:hypothetical protein